jgi:hypothetical protein
MQAPARIVVLRQVGVKRSFAQAISAIADRGVRLNDKVALKRRLYLDRDAVARRAAINLNVAALLASELEDLRRGVPKRAQAGSRLLHLLELDGEGSAATLARIESAFSRFDSLSPAGWTDWKETLAEADTTSFPSKYSELVIADSLTRWGHRIESFGPRSPGGKRADLEATVVKETFTVEVSTPHQPYAAWVEHAMSRLFRELER